MSDTDVPDAAAAADVVAVTIDALRSRITRVFPAQVRAAIERLTDEQLWWRPNETSNSIGNLILHLAGSIDYYLNRNIGNLDFTRDRAAEFAERNPIPKAALLARFDTMVANAETTFASLTPARLGSPSPEPTMYRLAVEDVINVLAHFSNHAGQIVWIAKMLEEGAVDEVWIRTHKREGAWRGRG